MIYFIILQDESIKQVLIYKVSLIHGDVLKYLLNLDKCITYEDSEKLFIQAIKIKSTEGIPFNQAGTLVQSSDPIKALLYFFMATLCKEPFNPSEVNITSILDNSRERFFSHIKKKNIIEYFSLKLIYIFELLHHML